MVTPVVAGAPRFSCGSTARLTGAFHVCPGLFPAHCSRARLAARASPSIRSSLALLTSRAASTGERTLDGEVVFDHHANQLIEANLRTPSKDVFGLGAVADQQVNL